MFSSDDCNEQDDFSDFSGASELEVDGYDDTRMQMNSILFAPSVTATATTEALTIQIQTLIFQNLDQLNSDTFSQYFYSEADQSTILHLQIPFSLLVHQAGCISEYQLKAWNFSNSASDLSADTGCNALSIVLRFNGLYENVKFAIGLSSTKPSLQPSEQELVHFILGYSANNHDWIPSATSRMESCLLSWSLADLLNEFHPFLLYFHKLNGIWSGAIDHAISASANKGSLSLESSRYPLLQICEFIQYYLSVAVSRCIVCHSSIKTGIDLLKPTTCSQFCLFRLITYDIGEDISQYVLRCDRVVDLMISLTYAAASRGSLAHSQFKQDTFPSGVGYTSADGVFVGFKQGQTDYILLVQTLDKLPSLNDMKEYLLSPDASTSDKGMYRNPSLRNMLDPIDRLLYPLLRWIIHSNPCSIRSIDSTSMEALVGLPYHHHQFEIVMSSPSKATKFQALKKECLASPPSLFAFHGSAVQNWLTILHKGLNYNLVANGRTYGNGIYYSLFSDISSGYSAARASGVVWSKSVLKITSVMSVNEIVHTESFFTSKSPHLVVNHADAVECRYLIVTSRATPSTRKVIVEREGVEYVCHDPSFRPQFGLASLMIPCDSRGQDEASSSKSVTPNVVQQRFRKCKISSNTALSAFEEREHGLGLEMETGHIIVECMICANEFKDVLLYWTLQPCCNKKLCTECATRLQIVRKDMNGTPHTFSKCPFCSAVQGIEIGTCADGHMTESMAVGGEFIQITYSITQAPYQTHRVTYFPNTALGRRVVDLIKIAWQRRLVFRIGTSMTTGQRNQSVWNIHHKTSISGGPEIHGYPDDGYLDRVLSELAERGVRMAE